MSEKVVKELLYRANLEGLRGYVVTGFIYPRCAGDNPIPQLIVQKLTYGGAAGSPPTK